MDDIKLMFRKEFKTMLDELDWMDDIKLMFRKEFKTMLDELDWMDDITRKKAHSKVDKMMPFIGYAKEILDDKLINEHYKGKSTILSLPLNVMQYMGIFVIKLKMHFLKHLLNLIKVESNVMKLKMRRYRITLNFGGIESHKTKIEV